MRAAPALLASLVLLLAPQAASEELIVSISTGEVRISSNFTGAAVTVFGAIERLPGEIAPADAYDIAVVLRGPAETVVARRKEPFLGMWINRASAVFPAAPVYYAAHGTGPIDTMAAGPVLAELRLGLANLFLSAAGRTDDATEAAEFRTAFLRLQGERGLYVESSDAVAIVRGTLFQTDFVLPTHIPVGTYTAETFAFADGVLVARAEQTVNITKTGAEQFLFAASMTSPILYGGATIALALFVGWLAGIVFRRD